MNGKLLQKIYFLKNAKKTCEPSNRDLNRDWITKATWQHKPLLLQLLASFYFYALIYFLYKDMFF